MATGALDANGIWQYGEDDSNTTFSALLNRLGTSIGSNMKGRIAQVVSASYSTVVTNATGSYIDTGLTATITPTSSTSKIVVIANTVGVSKLNDSASANAVVILRRNSDVIANTAAMAYTGSAQFNLGYTSSFSIFDAPATTSPVTYKTQVASAGGGTVQVQRDGSTSTIILVEVKQ